MDKKDIILTPNKYGKDQYFKIFKQGPHCMCCGEFIEDDDNALHISDKDKMN